MSTGRTYDIKVGYTCNNDCFHCVVKPNTFEYEGVFDLNYKEIIDCLKSQQAKEANMITITGGEPTVRRDFMRIVKFIHENYPQKQICLQTNGRKLKQYVEEFHDNNINIYFVVAIHGVNEVHNKVTGVNGVDTFTQTMEAIKEIQSVYGEFEKVARIEIVLSKLNLRDIYSTVKYLYEQGIKQIGISYPHLDGYYLHNPEEARKRGFSYGELKPELIKLYELCKEHTDLMLIFEKVPLCMWRDKDGKLLDIPANIEGMDKEENESVSVKYPGQQVNDNFLETYKDDHRQSKACSECLLCCSCLGTWFESIELFGEHDFIPITKEERAERCTY